MAHLRYAIRSLRRRPGFTAASLVVLALGIGANTALFTFVDGIVLRPLPVHAPDRLVVLRSFEPARPEEGQSFSYPMYRDLAEPSVTWTGVLARAGTEFSVTAAGESERVDGELVSGNYFDVLGVRPALGRLFSAADERVPGGHPVVVLDYVYWQRRLGGDPSIVGRPLLVNGEALTVVGITPASFYGTDLGRRPALRVPLAMAPVFRRDRPDRLTSRRVQWITLMARLGPGTSLAEAQAAAHVRYAQLLASEAASLPPSASPAQRERALSRRLELRDGRQGFGRLRMTTERPLLLLMLVTLAVWLIACVNLANLLLASGVGRRRELAIRLAVGGGRGDLVRQLMIENLLLATTGGLAGLLVAGWTNAAILALLPPGATLGDSLSLDLRVLGATFGFSVLTALAFGIVPARRATRVEVLEALKADGGARATHAPALGARGVLIAAQVALSLALLVIAILFVRSLGNIHRIDLGFAPDRVLVATLRPSLDGYPPERALALYDRLLDELRRSPDVEAAGLASTSPLSGNWDRTSVSVEGYAAREDEDTSPSFATVTPGYFAALGIHLVRGRLFTDRDRAGAERVAVINQAMARYFFGDEDPLGRRFRAGTDDPIVIVGVVADGKYVDAREERTRFVYVPLAQQWFDDVTLHVRTRGSLAEAAHLVRQAMRSLDPHVPLGRMTTLQDQIDASLAVERMLAASTTAFAALAVLLAAVGLYGVLALAVASRTQEIGVRLALGARGADIARMIARQTAGLIAAGLLGGVVLALGTGRALRALLYDLSPSDPGAFAVAVLVVAAVAGLAAALPTRRATRVDPLVALR